MNRILHLLLIVLSVLLCIGCDCVQYATGTVVDQETELPITGATVYKLQKEQDKSLTNEKGLFEINSISGGLFGCPPMVIMVKKEGYETLQHKGGGTIQLIKK